MPLLDADLARKSAHERKTGPLRLALALGIAALGLAIGFIFLLAPKQAAKAVQDVVQAAQALVAKSDPPAPAAKEEQDEAKPPTFSRRKPRHEAAAPDDKPALVSRTEQPPVATQPVTPQRRPFQDGELPPGTARRKVRELYGEPDLVLYKIEKDHTVENFVYVNRAQNLADSVLLVDERVTSVYSGVPLVSISEKGSERPGSRRSNN